MSSVFLLTTSFLFRFSSLCVFDTHHIQQNTTYEFCLFIDYAFSVSISSLCVFDTHHIQQNTTYEFCRFIDYVFSVSI